MANVASATMAIIPTWESGKDFPPINLGSQKAAIATTRPSRAYFTARLTRSDISTPGGEGVFVSGIFIQLFR